jgi:hypothetical protein
MDGESREKSVCSVLTGLIQFALRAVFYSLPDISFHCWPEVGAAKERQDLYVRQVKHPLVSISNQKFLAGWGHDDGWVGGGWGADPKILLDGSIRNAV